MHLKIYSRFIHSLFFLFIAFFFSSCKREKHSGFTETETGLFYKLQAIGEGERKPEAGDYLELQIVYKTEKDSVLEELSSHKNRMGTMIIPFQQPSFKGSFEEQLAEMNEGDSITCLVNADSVFLKFLKVQPPHFIGIGELLKLEVKLHSILNEEEYHRANLRYEAMMADADMEEQKVLKQYVEEHYHGTFPFENGLYFIPLAEGKGEPVEMGKTVLLNYKGYFLNGELFDATDEKFPFEYTIGEDEQLIKGIEFGINLMKNGGKAKFIIPSQLAFGNEGSSTGKIPPYTTVIYEVEVVKVY